MPVPDSNRFGVATHVALVTHERSDRAARMLFFGSIIYLPLLWILMIANRV